MATPLVRRRDSGGDSPMAISTGTAAAEYLLPADGRGIAAQATAALSLLTGLWVAYLRFSLRCSTAGSTPTSPT